MTNRDFDDWFLAASLNRESGMSLFEARTLTIEACYYIFEGDLGGAADCTACADRILATVY